MYSNQVYNLIQIGENNQKNYSGESHRSKYAHIISDLIRMIVFHVNTLLYIFRFYFILCLCNLATLRIPIPSDSRKRDHFLDPGTPSLAQGEAVLFRVLCKKRST